MKSIVVYTDGAVPNNQVKGNRKGGVGVFFAPEDSRNISWRIKETSNVKVTNQVCELLACIKALESIVSTEKISTKSIIIKTDSMYIVNTINDWAKKWEKANWKKADKKPIQNEDLVKKLFYLAVNLNAKFIHVRAHTTAPGIDSQEYADWFGNFMADKLAVDATKII